MDNIRITVVTRATRAKNLPILSKGIIEGKKIFDIVWLVYFDASACGDIPWESALALARAGAGTRFVEGDSGDWGHGLLNMAIDETTDGYIWFLDDDNSIMDGFWESLHGELKARSFPDVLFFDQYVGGRDFTGLQTRSARPDTVCVGGIDMCQFVAKRGAIGDLRFERGTYVADGIFAQDLKNKAQNVEYTRTTMCGYNALSISSGERGEMCLCDVDGPRTSENWEETSCVQTVGEKWEDYGWLVAYGSDMAKKWIHSEQKNQQASILCKDHYAISRTAPKISFFTPFTENARLERAYRSLVAQSANDWEWVLLDESDGRSVSRYAKSLSVQDPRVKYFSMKQATKGRIGEAKWRAACLCRGEYLVEFDHDDELVSDAAEHIIKAFEEMGQSVGFVYSDCAEIDESTGECLNYGDNFAFGYGTYCHATINGTQITGVCAPPINPKTIRHIVGVPNHVRAWRRETYFKAGGHNRHLWIADDYELIVRTFLICRFAHIPKVLYIQYHHGQNTHHSKRERIQILVSKIAEHYNHKIAGRFHELGMVDWAWEGNRANPLSVPSDLCAPSAELKYGSHHVF